LPQLAVVKRVLLAEGLLEVEVPDDWVVRATTLQDGQRVDLASPERYAEWQLQDLPEDVGTVVHRTHEPLEVVAERSMRRHVGNGEPDRFHERVGSVAARGYAWTDGVRDIATWFAQPISGIVVAIYVSLPGLLDPSRTHRDPVARGRMLLGSARWIE
jgi:hypothetical protein